MGPFRVRLPLVTVALGALVVTGCGSSETGVGSAPKASASGTVSVSGSAAPTRAATPAPPVPSISVPAELRSAAPDVELLGGDMSWPQCPPGTGIPEKQGSGAPYPLATARYVVLGLTNGPGFTPNPCLTDQVAWVKARRLQAAAYSVVSYPSPTTLARVGGNGPYDAGTATGRLRNAGYNQALFNVATMQRVGLKSPLVWLDVEPVPKFDWSSDTTANAAVVVGAARGYRDADFSVGVYSTQALWLRVVGSLRLGLPEWRAAGQTSRAEARRRCGPARSFQGGVAVLSQWVEGARDMNITCPGTSVRMAIWFHQY